jgi:hypothetical protein
MRYSKSVFGALLAGGLVYFSGCVTVRTPAMGAFYMDVRAGDLVSGNVGHSKEGTAEAKSYLGLVSVGDASIKAAMDKVGITKIHHVDYHSHSILGIIATYTVTVYGE